MPTVLVVEDPSICRFIRSALAPRGYRVVLASVQTACEILRSEPNLVDLLITNTPLDFCEFTTVALLYVAACPDESSIQPFTQAMSLKKPFHPNSLCECVERLIPSRRVAA